MYLTPNFYTVFRQPRQEAACFCPTTDFVLCLGSHVKNQPCFHLTPDFMLCVVCVRACVRACVRVCVCVCVRAQPWSHWIHDAGSHIKNQRYVDAMNMLMRFAQACDASHATSSQCKAYLGAVVVGLYAGNAAEAWATYQVRHPAP